MEIAFRSCGDCHACCDGFIEHRAYGNFMGRGRHCVFLVDQTCVIYDHRPDTCQYYQCGWSQNLFPEWMKPNLCGLLISVEVDKEKKQYLRVTEISDVVKYDAYNEIEKFVKENQTYWIKVPYRKIIKINETKTADS